MESENNNLNLTSIRIKQMRLDNSWTQKDLANKLGLKNDTAIANYEAGYSTPKDDIKFKMCEIFNCSMDYLMGKSDFKNEDDFYSKLDNVVRKFYYTDCYNAIKKVGVAQHDIEEILNIYFVTPNYSEISKDIQSVIVRQKEKVSDILSKYSSAIKNNVSNIIYDFLNSKEQFVKELAKSENIFNPNYKNNSNQQKKIIDIPIIGKITAGEPIFVEQYIEGYLPVDPNIYGLSTSDDLFYLLVSGDSMNQKVENGDYVLVHKQDYAEDGDIVVAVVNDDDEATLKRYKEINQQFIQLEPMSTNPIHQTRTIDLKNTNFKIIGKAIGKFGKF